MNIAYIEAKELLEDVSERLQSIVKNEESDVDDLSSWKPVVLDDLIVMLVKARSLMAVADRVDRIIKKK